MFVYMCVYVYILIYTHMYTYTYLSLPLYICLYICSMSSAEAKVAARSLHVMALSLNNATPQVGAVSQQRWQWSCSDV